MKPCILTRNAASFSFAVLLLSIFITHPSSARDLSALMTGTSPARSVLLQQFTPPPWQQWAQKPTALSVPFTAAYYPNTNSNPEVSINITLGATTVTNLITTINEATGCAPQACLLTGYAYLRPYQPTTLSVTGANLCALNIQLTPPLLMNLGLAKVPQAGSTLQGNARLPDRYKLYVNGVETNMVYAAPNNCCTNFHTNCLVEIRPDNDIRRDKSAGQDDDTAVPEDTAPGDGEWISIGPGKSVSTNITAIKWSVSLGRILSGKSAGRIHLMEFGITSNTYNPAILFHYQPFTAYTFDTSDPTYRQVQVFTNKLITSDIVLRQIVTPQAVADIDWNPTNVNGFEIRFFPTNALGDFDSDNNYYLITSDSPFVTWRFTNPDQDPTNSHRLRVEEIRPGITYTSEISFDQANIWTLTRGTGSEQRTETRAIGFNENYERLETNTITNSMGLAYQAVERYHPFPWGWELVSVATATGGETLTQEFDYYTNNASVNDYGKLKWVLYPDGYWEKRLYHSNDLYGRYAGVDFIELTNGHWWEYSTKEDMNFANGDLAYILTPWTNNTPSHPEDADLSNSHSMHYCPSSTVGKAGPLI